MEDIFYIALAANIDLDEIVSVAARTYEALDNKSMFVCDEPEFFKEHISKRGHIVIATNSQDVIIGYLMIRYPAEDADNLGKDLELAEELLNKVAHIESVAVLPAYRRSGVAYSMLSYAENVIESDGYSVIMATVAPENQASKAVFESSGYRSALLKKKYGGLDRCIYIKK